MTEVKLIEFDRFQEYREKHLRCPRCGYLNMRANHEKMIRICKTCGFVTKMEKPEEDVKKVLNKFEQQDEIDKFKWSKI